MYGFVGPDNYELYHDLHGPDGCWVYCVYRGDVGVVPYWSGDEEGDVYEGNVALPRTGSDEPVDMLEHSGVSTIGPGGPCDETGPVAYWSGDKEGDVYEGDVTLPRTGTDEPVDMLGSVLRLLHSGVCTICPGGPCDETGPVADAPGDVLVVSSECRDIDRGTLDSI